MKFQVHKLTVMLAGNACLFTLIKLFTAIATFHDDPSTFFVVRHIPRLTNFIFVTEQTLYDYYIVAVDENGLIGDTLYFLLTDYLWWIAIVLLVINLLFNRGRVKA